MVWGIMEQNYISNRGALPPKLKITPSRTKRPFLVSIFVLRTADIRRRCNFSLPDCSQCAELQYKHSESNPLKISILRGLSPKNKTPQKFEDAILDAEFNVDYDFFAKIGLAKWYRQVVDI